MFVPASALIAAVIARPGATATVFNAFGADIKPDRYVLIGRVFGYRVVIAEDCSGPGVIDFSSDSLDVSVSDSGGGLTSDSLDPGVGG